MYIFFCCSDELKDIPSFEEENSNSNFEERLTFSSTLSLEAAIKEGSSPELYRKANSRSVNGKFVSLLSKIPTSRTLGDDAEEMTYYESLGYDTLVPNPNFAILLNIKGELAVANEVMRITPIGTFVYTIGNESELEEMLKTGNTFEGDKIQQLSENITLYKTYDGISYSMDEEDSDKEEDSEFTTLLNRSFLGGDLDTSDFSEFTHSSNMLRGLCLIKR